MMELKFEKLYKGARASEPCTVAIPLQQGALKDVQGVTITDGKRPVPTQARATSRWKDGSVRWMLVDFLADLPGNAGVRYFCELHGQTVAPPQPVKVLEEGSRITVSTGALEFAVANHGLFEQVQLGSRIYSAEHFIGPALTDDGGNRYEMAIDRWSVQEAGPIRAVLEGKGQNRGPGGVLFDCELRITAWSGKPWVELGYRIVSRHDEPIHIASMVLGYRAEAQGAVRTCAANSNYHTSFLTSETGETVEKVIDAQYLLYEANEHIPEVFYGTLFADWCDSLGGVCATVYQAQQNFPKAVRASAAGLDVMLVPEGVDSVTVQPGMARQQRVLLHFHDGQETLEALNNRSLIYQMPDCPSLDPSVFRQAQVFDDAIYIDRKIPEVEICLIGKADHRGKGYGMLNWGDAPDAGYTEQGRGGGSPVWTNNEYDFPHAAMMMYARTGIRRFLDYMLVASRHWMDVDVCHYSNDPLLMDGQIMHINGHVIGGKAVCSHQWVEGLLDYYHYTGDRNALDTAIGIGENVLRRLATPEFQQKGEINARETGWALRTMCALYQETYDERWLRECDWIVGHFEAWEQEYGHWLSPYTDNTTIRVVFMISIACVSLMKYYRIRPQEKIKGMILRAVDDLLENCLEDTGLFYYKELPSLQRQGSNTIVLEALAIAYELSGNLDYLKAGLPTFRLAIQDKDTATGGRKTIVGDALIQSGPGPKGFAQAFRPLVAYYKAVSDNRLM